tara:strand:+ start:983 stop:1156 length:174 start_codon:yes stop_codon:yes gene_type:complete
MLTDTDNLLYYVYQSKYNREVLDTLAYGMTLEEFLKHRDYVSQKEDLEYASYKDESK